MCIISCFLQFRSFMLSQYRWAHEIYISTTFVVVAFFGYGNQRTDGYMYIVNNKAHRFAGILFPSNRNSVCIYRALNFIEYSKSILYTLLNEFTFFPSLFSVGHMNISPLWLFCLCVCVCVVQQWQWEKSSQFQWQRIRYFQPRYDMKVT